ncbi:retrovirus-related Pol polyprotein from transposon 17.6 [Trichonephila clavipes]|uniref:RNA-directed DNA polymerase n=1 Tax=Trichonephila clavipes TaxID=2585209 RepID=A0A8X6VIQ5_TRICX|nr:retrovirus-related Pol polyprotein from transposon 17.6 [Trichonephila clavipes]
MEGSSHGLVVDEPRVWNKTDDIVIVAKKESKAIDRLKKVFKVSSDYGWEINFDKCQFLHRKIEFLGHIIKNNKLFPSSSKTKSVFHYPELKTTKEVQRYLGLTGYIRKLIPAYSVIAKLLSDLLRKDTHFNFDVKQKASFDELKRLLCQKPVLSIYRKNCETEMHTEASIDGLAAVLLQRSPDDNSLHPIYYMSRKTSETERKYTTYELEVLAIIEALKNFKVYILGMPFKIITDCNAFTKTMSKKDLNTRIARWAYKIMITPFYMVLAHKWPMSTL